MGHGVVEYGFITPHFSSCGSSLSADELYKVDKTALSEILNTEKRNQTSQSQEGGRETQPKLKEQDADDDQGCKENSSLLSEEGEEEGGGKEEIGLEEILRACDDVQLPLDAVGDSDAAQTGDLTGRMPEMWCCFVHSFPMSSLCLCFKYTHTHVSYRAAQCHCTY